jgi:shikimate kinase
MFAIPLQALGVWIGTTSNGIGGGSMVCRIDDTPPSSIEEMSDTTLPNAVSPITQEAEISAALGRRSIVLVGMMGAGKSTIGRRLSARFGLPFLDADAEIEAAAGMSIPDIFESRGEADFRDGEARVIARLLDGGPAVIATGGGAVMRQETRDRIRDKAVSIWLKADPDIIMRRVKRRSDRPLLQTADPEATVERLIREREPVYRQADVTVWSRDVPHEKIVEECIEALHGKLCGDHVEPNHDRLGPTP